jgi:phytoene synthase
MRDRDLVRLYWPVELRPAFDALFAIDDALGEVVVSSTQPALGAIRLAWWREALERLDTSPPPPEPRLKSAALHLLPIGIKGAVLAELEAGWATLLSEWPDQSLVSKRGADLFGMAANILGADTAGTAEAGALFANIDVARRGISDARSWADELGGRRFPAKVRPLTMLAALAARDLVRSGEGWEREATPGRALTLLRHRITGTIA